MINQPWKIAGDFLELNRLIIHDVLKQQTMGVNAENFGGIVYFNIKLYSYMGFVNYIVYNFWENLIFLWFKRYIWKQEGSCTWASERGCTGCRVSHALVYIYISITQCSMITPISPDIWPCMSFLSRLRFFFQVKQHASSKDLWHTKSSNQLKTLRTTLRQSNIDVKYLTCF